MVVAGATEAKPLVAAQGSTATAAEPGQHGQPLEQQTADEQPPQNLPTAGLTEVPAERGEDRVWPAAAASTTQQHATGHPVSLSDEDDSTDFGGEAGGGRSAPPPAVEPVVATESSVAGPAAGEVGAALGSQAAPTVAGTEPCN